MVDRISNLPDPLLCHILSFLPTKLAVATSVLSQRWQQLWPSVPTLDFDDGDVDDQVTHLRFTEFVYAVMLSRNATQSIKSFTLKCRSSLSNPSNINRWVNKAIELRVEHLDLFLGTQDEFFYLPRGILTCKTLVVLKLNGFTLNSISSVELPSLKVLHLDGFYFSERRVLSELLSGCPILEDLLARELDFTASLSEAEFKSLPKLVRADISGFDISDLDIPLNAISNAEFLYIREVFHSNQAVNPNDIPVFHNLTHLELIFMDYTNWHWVLEMLKHTPKLQVLVVDKIVDNRLIDDKVGPYPQFVPECLLLHLKACSLGNYGGLEYQLQFARYIMQSSRVLRTMTICCAESSNPMKKLQHLKELSMCPRSSATCELLFE